MATRKRHRDTKHRTKIVITMGPASESRSVLTALLQLGVDILRVNTSHGSAEEHSRRINLARALAKKLHKPVQILVDLPGPKFRLGKLVGDSMDLKVGRRVRLVPPGGRLGRDCLPLRQPEILAYLKAGHTLHLADGLVAMEIERATPQFALGRVTAGGVVRTGAGLNLPNTDLHIRLPTPKDKEWIQFAALHRAEWLAVSFVQTASDICCVRDVARRYGYTPRVMAKIEKKMALINLGEIVREADGIMVARGDLGVETPLEEIPFAQKRIIAAANRHKKWVITATQMLESMVTQPRPTRAEVTDIANAVLDGTDAVMLSAESAIGKYPVQAVDILSRVLAAAEASA